MKERILTIEEMNQLLHTKPAFYGAEGSLYIDFKDPSRLLKIYHNKDTLEKRKIKLDILSEKAKTIKKTVIPNIALYFEGKFIGMELLYYRDSMTLWDWIHLNCPNQYLLHSLLCDKLEELSYHDIYNMDLHPKNILVKQDLSNIYPIDLDGNALLISKSNHLKQQFLCKYRSLLIQLLLTEKYTPVLSVVNQKEYCIQAHIPSSVLEHLFVDELNFDVLRDLIHVNSFKTKKYIKSKRWLRKSSNKKVNKSELKEYENKIRELIDIDNPSRKLLQALIDKIIIDKDRNIEMVLV